ncbi:hypothetical protein [Candidatus Methylobacter oryzae]|uniref:hypothetical protein n=1 Tax=Candidatus Methylobacter oryzae TaxID=2497749 RepID=UPI0010AEA7CA|nr:hypothetical protein [Candidatus Methylobacter oryzae]
MLDKESNAIAKTNWDELQKDCSVTFSCSGSVVGLLGREMDNPEVGDFHTDTVRYDSQDLSKVNNAMVDIRNYANCGTVEHADIMDVAILAVKALDASLLRVLEALSVGVQMLITAAHGNIEQMVDKETGKPQAAHTTTSVSSVYASGSLFTLFSTVPAMSGVSQPVEMTGRSLIRSV